MAAKDTKTQVLTWLIGQQMFGMKLGDCREVVRDRSITRVPYAGENVAGIVNLRGDVVTVLDLATMLGYEPEEGLNKFVIIRLKSNGTQVALKADRIYDVIDIEEGKIEPAPAHLNEMETKYIDGVAMTDKGLIVIVKANELLKAS